MYLRFVLSHKKGRGHERRGLFRLLDRLRARLSSEEGSGRLRDLLAWFDRHLPVPDAGAFNVPGSRCWFRAGARRHLERARDLLRLHAAAGWRGREIWNRDPGLLTYEDEVQIVARPRHVASPPA